MKYDQAQITIKPEIRSHYYYSYHLLRMRVWVAGLNGIFMHVIWSYFIYARAVAIHSPTFFRLYIVNTQQSIVVLI